MDAREEILGRLRGKTRPLPMPPAWQSRRDFADLEARFEEALTAVGGEVIRAAGLEQGLAALGELLRDLDVARAVANEERPLTAVDLPARFPRVTWHRVGRSAGDLRAFCASADVGLSGAVAALAETGTVIIDSGPGRSRLATLLPPVHVVLLPASRLTADLFTWTAVRQAPPPSNLTLISGPSKTADIERTLATGVHGPKRFIVILIHSL